uniref:Uncharacterized protein n=1 Tax=Branchiostoma floridae TaxID=7739 RepID=C3Y708_BRAFL|eukprot:XP_002608108.1 hypothetical protein BRAFLDRAFT_91414 [Branchiostoma floridae]
MVWLLLCRSLDPFFVLERSARTQAENLREILGSQHRHRVQDLLNWESGRAKIIAHSLLNCQSGALQVVDLREALPNLHVYLNMWTEDCLMEEGKVAKSLSPEERGIKLHPFRVVTVSLGSTLERLGRRLEPQVLTGLELKSDTFETADSFATLLGGGKFPNLSALSLPNFAKPLEPADFQVLGEVLSHLPALRRLNLNGLRVMGQLRQLLQNMPGHLEHLNVSHCRLVSIDVLFLYESRHADTLRELSICGSDRIRSLATLHLDAMHLNESFAELARAKLGNVNGKNRPKKVQAQYDPDTGLTVLKVLWMDTAM